MPDASVTALRGTIVSFTGDPFLIDPAKAFVHEPDGLIVCRNGRIEAAGPYDSVRASLPASVPITDYSGCILSAGFVDTHVHYVQTEMIASPGKQLLQWVNDYIYPAEEAFAYEAHARSVASVFCDTLIRNGTTTACIYCAVYPQSVDALFEEALKRNLLLVAGKCMMDRNVPEALRDTAQSGYDQSKALIERWHGKGRLLYAITPRWAGSSTPAQLEAAGALWHEYPDLTLQTHIAENRDEVAFVTSLFPERKDFLDITIITASSGGAPFSAMAFGSPTQSSPACMSATPRSPIARPRTCSSAAGCFACAWPRTRSGRSMSASAPISAQARASRCCGPSTRPTRSRR
jgi:guanine deaminase